MGGRLTRLDFVLRFSCLDICVFSNRLDSPSAVRQTDVKTFFAGLFVMTNAGRQLFQQAGNISSHNSHKNIQTYYIRWHFLLHNGKLFNILNIFK